MAVKFPLKMADGAEVRTLHDLREHFDLGSAMKYLRDGTLLKWLDARNYDEVETVEDISASDPQAGEKLCEALGIQYDGGTESSVNEKRARLREMTSDINIINNASQTAFNDEDLSDLLNEGINTIYLCGKIFNIPLRKPNRHYIGILGKPRITTKATCIEELRDKGIVLENVIMPWRENETHSENVRKENEYRSSNKTYQATMHSNSRSRELKEQFEALFKRDEIWGIANSEGELSFDDPSNADKRFFLKMLNISTADERKLIHARVADDSSAGWALTDDAFYVGGNICLISRNSEGEDHSSNDNINTWNDYSNMSIRSHIGDLNQFNPDNLEPTVEPKSRNMIPYDEIIDVYFLTNPNQGFIDTVSGAVSIGFMDNSTKISQYGLKIVTKDKVEWTVKNKAETIHDMNANMFNQLGKIGKLVIEGSWRELESELSANGVNNSSILIEELRESQSELSANGGYNSSFKNDFYSARRMTQIFNDEISNNLVRFLNYVKE